VRLVQDGPPSCRDSAEALALGKVFERSGAVERAIACYAHAADDRHSHVDVQAEACYRLAVRYRRDRRHADAADMWRRILTLKNARVGPRSELLAPLRRCATEALAIHHEHRERDYEAARDLALQLLDEIDEPPRVERTRHRLARLEKKIGRSDESQLFV
jgi:tetratricopeptide (TPR) repeat protein